MAIRRGRFGGSPKPSEEAHRQVIELLKLGERSSNADIRDAAIEIAKNTSADQRARAAHVSPGAIMAAGTAVFGLAIAACWYALTHYPDSLGRSISEIIIIVAILLVALYALLSGHLSQENFVKLCSSAWGWIKSSFSGPPPVPAEKPLPEGRVEQPAPGEDLKRGQ